LRAIGLLEICDVHISVAYRNGCRSESCCRVCDLNGVINRSGARRIIDKGVTDRLDLAAYGETCACVLNRLNRRAVPLQFKRDRQVHKP